MTHTPSSQCPAPVHTASHSTGVLVDIPPSPPFSVASGEPGTLVPAWLASAPPARLPKPPPASLPARPAGLLPPVPDDASLPPFVIALEPDPLEPVPAPASNKFVGEGLPQATAAHSVAKPTRKRSPCVIPFCIAAECTSKPRYAEENA
jgi:hypothetical protein